MGKLAPAERTQIIMRIGDLIEKHCHSCKIIAQRRQEIAHGRHSEIDSYCKTECSIGLQLQELGKRIGTRDKEEKNVNDMRGSGSVTTYKLSPEELEKVREKTGDSSVRNQNGQTIKQPVQDGSKREKPVKEGPNCGLTKEKFLEQIAAGETISSIEKAWNMKFNTLTVWVKKWDLRGITMEKARQLLELQVERVPEDAQTLEDQPHEPTAEEREELFQQPEERQEIAALLLDELSRLRVEFAKTVSSNLQLEEENAHLKALMAEKDQELVALANQSAAAMASAEVLYQRSKPTDPNLLTIRFELHDYGADSITQELKVEEELGELDFEIHKDYIDLTRAMSEYFDVGQALTGLIRSRLNELMVKNVNPVITRYVEHHNELHIQKLRNRLKAAEKQPPEQEEQ